MDTILRSHVARLGQFQPTLMSKMECLIKYGIVGILTSVIYILTGTVLWMFAGLGKVTASTIAFVVAIGLNYTAHKNWSFRSTAPHQYVAVRYFFTIATGMAINATVVHVGTQVFAFHYVFVQMIAISVVVSWNFVAFSTWVFRT